MSAEERYLALYDSFNPGHQLDETYEITLDELMEIFYCTRRNVKFVIRKLVDQGLIGWQAGLGRGHRSRLSLLVQKEHYLFELAVRHARSGEYKYAFELLERYGGNTAAQERFMAWLTDQFGYHQETGRQLDGCSLDTLRLPVYRPLTTLDPAMVYYCFDSHMIRQLFDRLLRFDESTGRIMPGIAHHWTRSEDGLAWTFYLQKGVRFHHGREVEAEDVVFTIERQLQGLPNSWMLDGVERVEAEGPRIVKFTLSKPKYLLPRFLCGNSMSIVPKDLVQQSEETFSRHPVGSGPFKLVKWTEGHVVMAAHTDYFERRPHLDVVELILLPDDRPLGSRPKDWKQLITDHESVEEKPEREWQTIEEVDQGCTLLTWNMNKEGPHRHRTFRQAIDLLTDRSGMIRDLGGNRKLAASGFRHEEGKPKPSEQALDKTRVNGLLAEAGYAGEPITISSYSIHEQDARWIVDRCAEFGIRVEFRLEDWHTIRNTDLVASVDGILYGVVFAEDEVCELELYEQEGSFIKEHLDPEFRLWVKGRIDEAMAKEGPEDRRRILFQIEQRLRDECKVMFLLHKKVTTHFHPDVKGVSINSLGWIDFQHVWLEKPSEHVS
ncbi:SgrR family transcriptional regulator [Paenibacillus harenae]|uniref:MarR-like DNA-binding transcriptional regulator SgrR of sgrS sRNA n=1 Tax=Paenibacillus harenae TaxID=306543 RepID=A0ABT9U427_PAEHA|nr:SgrR family transcriptional regulator [Paenibacillus harenae]MDQ0113997.1 MarR-like DNA-binding transcriptional regulator SgrR of sgrS sRNA [Paenibacillus harenae]